LVLNFNCNQMIPFFCSVSGGKYLTKRTLGTKKMRSLSDNETRLNTFSNTFFYFPYSVENFICLCQLLHYSSWSESQ
jgi:hypothetical protein